MSRLFGFVFIAVIAVIQMHLVGTELHPPSAKLAARLSVTAYVVTCTSAPIAC
jgi:hypothetical protein